VSAIKAALDPVPVALDHLPAYAADLDAAGQSLNAATIRRAEKHARAKHAAMVEDNERYRDAISEAITRLSGQLDAPAWARRAADRLVEALNPHLRATGTEHAAMVEARNKAERGLTAMRERASSAEAMRDLYLFRAKRAETEVEYLRAARAKVGE